MIQVDINTKVHSRSQAATSSEVYLMDCIELMKHYPDNYFDLAIVDPPYGIGADKAQNAAAAQREKANGKSKAGRGWKAYKETDWDNETPSAEYWRELRRVSKNQIVWGGELLYRPFRTENGLDSME